MRSFPGYFTIRVFIVANFVAMLAATTPVAHGQTFPGSTALGSGSGALDSWSPSLVTPNPMTVTPNPLIVTPNPLMGPSTSLQKPSLFGAKPRSRAITPVFPTTPSIDPMLTSQTRQVLGFYGGQSARAILSQLPRRTPITPKSVASRRTTAPRRTAARRRTNKPFQTVIHSPTISPYININRDEDSNSNPNYYVFVRPLVQQRDTNRRSQREMQRINRQLQSASNTIASPRYRATSLPGTGSRPATFMDTAQFYGTLR